MDGTREGEETEGFAEGFTLTLFVGNLKGLAVKIADGSGEGLGEPVPNWICTRIDALALSDDGLQA